MRATRPAAMPAGHGADTARLLRAGRTFAASARTQTVRASARRAASRSGSMRDCRRTSQGRQTMERQMKSRNSASVASAIVAGLILFAPRPSLAQDVRGGVETIVKDYLAAHPDEV